MNNDDNNLAALRLGQHLEPEDMLQYVLEMLTPEEQVAVEEHLAGGCAQCREELAAVRDDIGAFALSSVELTDAPAASLGRLMAEVDRDGKAKQAPHPPIAPAMSSNLVNPASSPAPGAARGMTVVSGARAKTSGAAKAAAWIGWAVAAALAVAATHYYQERQALRGTLATQSSQISQLSADQAKAREIVDTLTDRSAQRVSLSLTKAPAPPQPTGRATYLASRGTLIFLASHLDPLPAGKTYELWVIPASGKAPVPAGTFHPDAQGNANVVTSSLADTGPAKAIGITIEAAGGSDTPTLPIVMAGS